MTRAIHDCTLDPRRVQASARFQPRTEKGVTDDQIESMRQGGRDRGYPSGWDPDRYDAIRVARNPIGAPPGDYVFEGYHRRALAVACGEFTIGARLYTGYTVKEIVDLAETSNAKTRPHEPLEEAAIYARRLYEEGATPEQVATALDRRDPAYYVRRAELHYLCDDLKTAVRDRTLRVEYAEVIGRLARNGATAPFQRWLRDIAYRKRLPVGVFRALADGLLRRARPPAGSVGHARALFDLSSDAAIAAAEEELGKALEKAAVREAWQRLATAGQALLKRIQKGGAMHPPAHVIDHVTRTVDAARVQVTAINGEIGGDDDNTDGGVVAGAVADAVEDGVRQLEIVANPVVKWPGSKRDQRDVILPLVRGWTAQHPEGRFIEPFAGGAAIYLALGPARGILGDAVEDLVILYRAVREDHAAVHRALLRLAGQFPLGSEEAYYAVRSMQAAVLQPPDRAARMIYLSKTTFNGLWRENGKGIMNSPFGGADRAVEWPTLADLAAVARALRGASIVRESYRTTIDQADAGDLVYADPPFEGSFTGYSKARGFELDYNDLADRLWAAVQRGAMIVTSQPAITPSHERYAAWCEVIQVQKTYAIGGSKKKRADSTAAQKGEVIYYAPGGDHDEGKR